MNNVPSLPISHQKADPKAEEEDTAARLELQLRFGHASTLHGTASFQWFREHVLKRLLEEQTEIALDRSKSPEERDLALEKKDIYKELYGWAESTMKTAAECLNGDS